MARSTGPILTAGAITWANRYLLADEPARAAPGRAVSDLFTITTEVGIATGIAVGIFSLLEKAAPELAVILAWATVITVLFVRVPPGSKNPTPLERAFNL